VVVPPEEIVSEMVVVWEIPPPLAFTVIVDVPTVAVLLALKVSVELPEPGAAIDVGLKAAVTPAGSPLAESETAELKPPEPWLRSNLFRCLQPQPRRSQAMRSRQSQASLWQKRSKKPLCCEKSRRRCIDRYG